MNDIKLFIFVKHFIQNAKTSVNEWTVGQVERNTKKETANISAGGEN